MPALWVGMWSRTNLCRLEARKDCHAVSVTSAGRPSIYHLAVLCHNAARFSVLSLRVSRSATMNILRYDVYSLAYMSTDRSLRCSTLGTGPFCEEWDFLRHPPQ